MTTRMEVQQTENEETPSVVGYALKFNRDSEDLGFIERIDSHALDQTDMSDVYALINHDDNYVLARTGNNLNLTVDDIGLKFEFKPTNTSYSRDLVDNLKAGLVNKCSFAFTVANAGDEWEERNGKYYRTINNIERLYDVSVVTYPAYSDTEVVLSQRSRSNLERVKHNRSRELELLQLYMGR